MKQKALLLSLTLLAGACRKAETPTPLPAEDPTWLKLEIPTQWSSDQAFAVIGSLDQTLLVTTTTGIYSTADQGKTWQLRRTVAQNVWGLLPRHDTIFALISYRANQNDKLTANEPDYFTTDFGRTWAYTSPVLPYGQYRAIAQPYARVSAAGVSYQVQDNWVPYQPGATAKVQRASDLLRTAAGGKPQAMRLPGRHFLNNLHLDAQNRLYVTASSLRFDETTGEPLNETRASVAVVYVSRQPLP